MRQKFYFYSLLLILVSMTAACGSTMENRPAKWAQPLTYTGLDNLFIVSEDVYRSAQPKKKGMTSAKQLGVKTVLSLRETELDGKLNEEEGTGLNLVHIPIETTDVTDQNILDALKVLRDGPRPVLVHCRHGSDRTGLIVAMYRMVFQNWSKEEAKDELINGGYGYHSMFKNIPEEIDQADIAAIKATIFAAADGKSE